MNKSFSDFNLQSINTQQLTQHCNATIQYGGNLLVIGQRGSGKTTIAKETVSSSGFKELVWCLATFERVDLSGYPLLFSPPDTKYVSYLLPYFFKPLLEGDQKVVLILDELDKADFSILAPLLDILQLRSINGRPLVNLHAILMTGNLPAEGGKKPPPPLLDRAEKYLVEPDFKSWSMWGASHSIHPSIIAYLADNSKDLVGDLDQGENYAERSPRGWENSSKLVTYGEKNNWHSDLIMAKVAGCIGRSAGLKYSSYFKYYQGLLPIINKIAEGEKSKDFKKMTPNEQMVAIMILCSRVGQELEGFDVKQPHTNLVKNVGKFLLQTTDPEMALIGIRSGIGRLLHYKLEGEISWDTLINKMLDQAGM